MIAIVRGGRRYAASTYVVRAPAVGAWTAEVTIAADDTVTAGPCEISHGAGDAWAGTIRRIHTTGGRMSLDVRAGADGLEATTLARHWAGYTDALEVLRTLAGDAGETADTSATGLGSWRARGRTLREEVEALARWVGGGGWRYTPAGALTLGAPTWDETPRPGALLGSGAGWRAYACDGLPELAGGTVDGERVGLATYVHTGQGVPSVDLRAERPARTGAQPLVGGTVEALTDGRATVRLDDGTVLGDVPLWHVPGVRAVVPPGVRVIVADLGGDPRQPVAFAAPFDGAADELRLGDAGGRAIREGDWIMMPSGSAATPTAVRVTLSAPGAVGSPAPLTEPGEPGVGYSRVLL